MILYGEGFLSSFVAVKASVDHKFGTFKASPLVFLFYTLAAIWLFEKKSRKEICACTHRMKEKERGWRRKTMGSAAHIKTFFTHGLQSVRIIA